jgi:hypothetical protein
LIGAIVSGALLLIGIGILAYKGLSKGDKK